MFPTLFRDEVFVVAAEIFAGSVSILEGDVVKLSALCDTRGRMAESAGPDTTAHASQTLECMIYCFSAAQMTSGAGTCFVFERSRIKSHEEAGRSLVFLP